MKVIPKDIAQCDFFIMYTVLSTRLTTKEIF